MLRSFRKQWRVSNKEFLIILCVFAVTGLATAFLSKAVTGWVGFTQETHWSLKLLVRLCVLLLGYQIALLTVAFLFGQFAFFWQYEKRFLQRLHILEKENKAVKIKGTMKNESVKIKIGVFASGTGSNAEKLIQYFKASGIASIALIVCNKEKAGVTAIAEKEGVPVLLIEKERFLRGDAYLPFLKEQDIGFLVLAGFLWKIPQALINAYPRRIVNIHPALLPKFGGKGMYGQYVHEAALNAGEVESGITIHYVDEHYDNGDIIFQTACPILPGDKPGDIAQRIHTLEHLHYPRVIEEVLKEL